MKSVPSYDFCQEVRAQRRPMGLAGECGLVDTGCCPQGKGPIGFRKRGIVLDIPVNIRRI